MVPVDVMFLGVHPAINVVIQDQPADRRPQQADQHLGDHRPRGRHGSRWQDISRSGSRRRRRRLGARLFPASGLRPRFMDRLKERGITCTRPSTVDPVEEHE